MSLIKLSDKLTVGSAGDARNPTLLTAHRVSDVIDARKANEEPGQIAFRDQKAALADVGVTLKWIPVSLNEIRLSDVRAFHAVLSNAQGHVLAHCKAGLRAFTLYAAGQLLNGLMNAEDIIALGKQTGFDSAPALAWVAKHSGSGPLVEGFYESRTGSIQYVVVDQATKKCAIIDPVLDYDEKSGSVATHSADQLLNYIADNGFELEWILDTHPHADHFSAAQYLKQKTGVQTAIGERVKDVQNLWQGIYNLPNLATDGSQWDHLFSDGDRFKLGSLEAEVIFSPGHTLASITYVIGDAAFVHDTLFMPDSGTARADFPGGSADRLLSSIKRILALPGETRVFTGHDYQQGGREAAWESTVGQQLCDNIHLAGVRDDEFITIRTKRDQTLPMPKLILHALQVNIRGGRFPEAEDNGVSYLKIPIGAFKDVNWG